jgi:hypothetical protein
MSSLVARALLVLFVGVGSACAVEEIVLVASGAVEPAADAGPDSGGRGRTCRPSDECAAGENCGVTRCNDDERRCGGPSDPPCPSGAFCARLSLGILASRGCETEMEGTCLTLSSDDCESNLGPDRWMACAGLSAGSCTDLCTAIRSGMPHVLLLGNGECAP